MNEATLEARIHQLLLNVFPTFQKINLTHQQSFSIKFGRRNVKVDLKDPSTYPNRAIFDILLSCNGTNCILLELKEPGHDVNVQEDIEQGLSYARLIHPMPPVVLISNGTENLFFDTYTKQKINTAALDFDFIQKRINNSFKLATTDFNNAVNLLLNRNPVLIGKVFRNISRTTFEYQIGTINNLDKPICPNFQIARKVVRRIYKVLDKGANLIGLIGHAFSGKTNVLYQFFRNYGFTKQHYVLYINLKDWNFTIFQHLAIELSKETRGTVTKEKVRDWFTSLVYTDSNAKIILLVDNLSKDIPENVLEEILEIIAIFKGTKHSIVYSIDEWTYKQIAYVENRHYKTIIGSLTKYFFLRPLNSWEFNRARKKLYLASNVLIQQGGSFTQEYREVRILRNIAATLNWLLKQNDLAEILAIPTIEFIYGIANNAIFTKKIHEDYKKLAMLFSLEQPIRDRIPQLSIVAVTMAAVSQKSFVNIFGNKELKKLLKSGVVVEREYIKGLSVLLPKIPELVVYHAIDAIYYILRDNISKKEYPQVYTHFLKYCSAFPDGDIIGMGILNKIGTKDIDLFTYIIVRLMDEKPEIEKIQAGTKVAMFSERYGHIQLHFEDDMDEEDFINQHLPFSILAQLAHRPFESENEQGQRSFNAYLSLLYKVGSFPGLLARIGLGTLDAAQPIKTVIIKDIGTFASGANGIVETIVQALGIVFLNKPQLIEELHNKASSELNYHLLWRIDLAIRSCTRFCSPELSKKGSAIIKINQTLFRSVLNKVTGLNIPDSDSVTEEKTE